MREVSVKIYDDLDYARDRAKHEAAVSVTIGLDGVWAELDLSEVNSEQVRHTIGEWMAAGHAPEGAPPRRSGRRPGPQGKIPPESLARGKAIRAFAAAAGFSISTANGSGKRYYSDPLRRAFDRAIAEYTARTGFESDSVELYEAFREHLEDTGRGQNGTHRREAVQESDAGAAART